LNGVWTQLAEGVLTKSYTTTTTALVAGNSYWFRVIARNSVGLSTETPSEHVPVYILVAQAPAQPLAPTTARDFNKIIITWQEPANTGSSAILSYRIQIRNDDDLTFSETAQCDGSVVTVRDAHRCTVLISTLTTPPFSLAWGKHVFARVSATNIKGTSPYSEAGNGDLVAISPDVPTGLANVPAITTASQIGLTWVEGTTFYGLPVLDYTLSYD
jgi:hypothetical protein